MADVSFLGVRQRPRHDVLQAGSRGRHAVFFSQHLVLIMAAVWSSCARVFPGSHHCTRVFPPGSKSYTRVSLRCIVEGILACHDWLSYLSVVAHGVDVIGASFCGVGEHCWRVQNQRLMM